jgi:uncharacterized membrane protein YhaH (DUF805 family)
VHEEAAMKNKSMKTRSGKTKIMQAVALLIAFVFAAAVATVLNLQGVTSYLTVIFLAYCAIIVVSHLLSALSVLVRAWRDSRRRPKALLLWQSQRDMRSKPKTKRLAGD